MSALKRTGAALTESTYAERTSGGAAARPLAGHGTLTTAAPPTASSATGSDLQNATQRVGRENGGPASILQAWKHSLMRKADGPDVVV